jgi:hypothetical protein
MGVLGISRVGGISIEALTSMSGRKERRPRDMDSDLSRM